MTQPDISLRFTGLCKNSVISNYVRAENATPFFKSAFTFFIYGSFDFLKKKHLLLQWLIIFYSKFKKMRLLDDEFLNTRHILLY